MVEPDANSCVFSLPIMMAPASLSLATTVESSCGTNWAHRLIFEPPVVRVPLV